jgi:transposase-like protein
MFESLKSLWKKDESAVEEYSQQATLLAENIKTLEAKLAEEPRNSDIQKQLMLLYNRALNVYAKSKTHRQDVDSLFLRIDELRNIIRRNI